MYCHIAVSFASYIDSGARPLPVMQSEASFDVSFEPISSLSRHNKVT